ncbi:hypothetical protein ACLMJK_001669 [Lecanora helva]
MSLGKFTTSLASATQETTVALAALNFDFSVFKTEAPAEYKLVGTSLTSHRREFAEDGDIHSTARKLRAIFAQILPSTPSLYQAYGKRASEIASSSQVSKHDKATSGAFSEHLGVDGGSIWAAATSGPGAVAIHLLGCMLARIWSAPEATSIWEEIVLERKRQLSVLDGHDPQNALAGWAAKCAFSREQLATWDASARAWLQTADEKHRFKQKQLKLIIENIDVPVNSKINVYDSVISAWVSAMVTLNKLIEGMPHSIENSAILLALSAWHLFPNMSVLSTQNQFVKQDDPLIDSRGILTLGLQSASGAREMKRSDDLGNGITWSLPLAHYRFYGDPVEKEKALNTDGSRISISQLLQVCLGCMFVGFNQRSINSSDAAQLMLDIWNHVSFQGAFDDNYHKLSDDSWLAILAGAAKNHLDSRGLDRAEYTRLFNYGRRRCPQFLGLDRTSISPIMNLKEPSILLSLMQTHNDRISLLRQKATRLGGDPSEMIIRYALTKPTSQVTVDYAIATVLPIKMDRSEKVGKHLRWETGTMSHGSSVSAHKVDNIDKGSFEILETADILGPLQDGKRLFWNEAPTHFSNRKSIRTEVDAFFGQFAEFALFRGKIEKGNPRIIEGVPFELLFGDPAIGAIYRIPRDGGPTSHVFEIEDVRGALAVGSKLISQNALLRHLAEIQGKQEQPLVLSKHMRSLKTLATLCKVYKYLGDTAVAMASTAKHLHACRWMPDTDLSARQLDKMSGMSSCESYQSEGASSQLEVQLYQAFEPLELDLASTFACIVMLESGHIDLPATGMNSTMAMSSGNSLFIATSLLSDPSSPLESKIKRIRGNVGRPGIAMLVPPEEPRTRKTEAHDWNYLDFDEFDGSIIDSFQATSLHMSFTDFVLPIDTGTRGLKDTEIYFLETVISVHDKGQWMGDLNIMPVHEIPLLRFVAETASCKHGHTERSHPELVSIDSWREFFDRPDESAVFRARGSWMARLAATTFSVAQGHRTLVFGEKICWACGMEQVTDPNLHTSPIYII